MPGSVVVGSSRSGSAGPKTRHAHSTSRRASWQSGNLYRQSTSRSTIQQEQRQRSPPSRLGVEESESAAALHGSSLMVGSDRSMREPSSAAVRERPVRVPMAVPRGREVCGGAPVGVDVAAVLQPCIEQVSGATIGRVAHSKCPSQRPSPAFILCLLIRRPSLVKIRRSSPPLMCLLMSRSYHCTHRIRHRPCHR